MILVTGATGFLGSELVKQLLKAGKTVRAIKRSTSIIPSIIADENIEWIEADILDYFALETAFETVEYVYHCAAVVSFDPKDKKNVMRVNVEGTENIVNLCQQKNIKKLVHVSSVAALGGARNGALITEENYWEPNKYQSNYSISKFESEMEVHRAIAEGLNAVVVNPSVIIGKNSGKKGSGQLFETVRKGLKFYTSGECGFVDVEDVAKSMILLMSSDFSGQRFIVNAENLAFKDFFSRAASGFGLAPPTIKVSSWMLRSGAIFAKLATLLTGRTFGLTSETARSATQKQNFSSKKIEAAVGIKFKPISRSIKEICENFKHE